MKNVTAIFGYLIAALLVVFSILLIPKIVANISAQNANIAATNYPGAAWNRVQATWINTGGSIVTQGIERLGDSLLP